MAANPTNLILEDLVVEPRLEFTLASGSGGDIHGGLTTAEDDEVLLAGDASAVEGGIGGVGLEDLEVPGGDELGRAGLAWGTWTLLRRVHGNVPWRSCPCRR